MESKKWVNKFRAVCRTAMEEYVRWITGSKMLLLVFLFVYTKGQITDQLLQLVKITGNPLQVFEPGIAFLGSRPMMMVLPLVYLVLMANFPREDGNKTFFMFRTGKGVWFLGQFLFALAGGMTTILVCVLAVTLPCLGNISWNNGGWSETVTKYYQSEDAMNFRFNLITEREYNHMTPGAAFLHSILLVLLFLMLISAIQLFCSVCEKKVLDFAIVGCIVTIGNALAIFENQRLMWFFPCANTQIWLRHDEILREETVRLQTSYGYFLVLLAIITFFAWKKLKKRNIRIS